jgi:signal transduction histidine kinase
LGARLTAVSEMNLDIEFEDYSGALIAGSETLLSRMVENVMDNAIRYNERGGWIRASTKADGNRVRLVVENGGDVIAEESVAELAQPFKRLGSERTGSDTGTGLGLSFVAAVAESHGGTLELHALGGGGLQVVIELPVVASALVGALT